MRFGEECSIIPPARRCDGIGRRDGLKIRWANPPCGFESHHRHHVGASCISLAPTFFKSQSAPIALLLLSKPHPLRWASIWFWTQSQKKSDFTHLLQIRNPHQSTVFAAKRKLYSGGDFSLSGRIRCAGFLPDFEAVVRFASFVITQDILER